jgi:pyridoxal biosynthesis lyase PdxS
MAELTNEETMECLSTVLLAARVLIATINAQPQALMLYGTDQLFVDSAIYKSLGNEVEEVASMVNAAQVYPSTYSPE